MFEMFIKVSSRTNFSFLDFAKTVSGLGRLVVATEIANKTKSKYPKLEAEKLPHL